MDSTATYRTGVGAGGREAEVAALPERIVAAWAAHDADTFAEVFTEDGSMVLPGVYRKGREEIRSFMAEAFAGPYRGSRVTGQPVELRLLGESAAILITQGGVVPAGQTTVPDDQAIRASWVAVDTGDGWRLAAYQNSPRDRS